jgi:hypothetical protein
VIEQRTRTFLHLATLATTLVACGDQSDRPTGLEPTIDEVRPALAGLPGGATGTITGSNFLYVDAGDPIVVVGGVEVEAAVVDDATITFTVPPGDTPGESVDVAVFNGNGYAIATDVITYNDPPAVFGVDVTHGREGGGDVVTMSGRGFAANAPGQTLVRFGAATTDEVTVVDDSTIEVIVPPRADADRVFAPLALSLHNDNGDATAVTGFTYTKRALLALGNNRGRRLFAIDPDTFDVIDTGAVIAGISGYALDASGQAWAVTSGRTLIQFDPLGAATTIGRVAQDGQDRQQADLVIVGEEAFGYTRDNTAFGSIDLTTAAFSPIGAPLGLACCGVSVALGPRNESSVYLATRMSEPLRSISLLSGTVTTVATMDGPSDRLAHGMTLLDGKLFVLAHDRNSTSWVYEVDPQTGELTERATIPSLIGAFGPTPAGYE